MKPPVPEGMDRCPYRSTGRVFESNPVPIKFEPPNAQAIYAVLDGAMSAILTDPNASVDDHLKRAEEKVNQLLAAAG
jgi:multiple sugar transport system substrate-binding protein